MLVYFNTVYRNVYKKNVNFTIKLSIYISNIFIYLFWRFKKNIFYI